MLSLSLSLSLTHTHTHTHTRTHTHTLGQVYIDRHLHNRQASGTPLAPLSTPFVLARVLDEWLNGSPLFPLVLHLVSLPEGGGRQSVARVLRAGLPATFRGSLALFLQRLSLSRRRSSPTLSFSPSPGVPADQRAAVAVAADEVGHRGGHDPQGPRRALQPGEREGERERERERERKKERERLQEGMARFRVYVGGGVWI